MHPVDAQHDPNVVANVVRPANHCICRVECDLVATYDDGLCDTCHFDWLVAGPCGPPDKAPVDPMPELLAARAKELEDTPSVEEQLGI